MPAQSRRHPATEHDDPWGFGAPEGTLVEVRYDPHAAAADRSGPAARETEPFRGQPPPPAKPGAIDLTPGGGKAARSVPPEPAPSVPPEPARSVPPEPARGVPPEPAGDARLPLGALNQTDEYPLHFRPRRLDPRWFTAALALGVALVVGGGYVWFVRDPANRVGGPLPVGMFVLSSQPAGAEVLLDGVAVGRTPLALQLTAGDHSVVATSEAGVSERLTVRVPAGESASQHLMLDAQQAPAAAAAPQDPTVAAPAPRVGTPSAAPVPRRQVPAAPTAARPPDQVPTAALPSRGGVPIPARTAAGTAPASTPDSLPSAATPGRSGTPPAPAAARTPGFVTFDLPFAAQIFEGGVLLGSSSSRLRVAPGTHTFTLVSPELGFNSQETVVVAPGQSTRHVVEQRTAPLSVNAQPWAEVFISGRSFGETPLANIALPIGTYQVTLRHPTLGEREVAVTVRLGAANRLAVDMRR